MSTLTILILIILAYIMQVLLVFAYPYYRYKQNNKKNYKKKSLKEFIRFAFATTDTSYIILGLIPFTGLCIIIMVILVSLISAFVEYLGTRSLDIHI